ncbi:MAG: efflux RND transporter periplasmic adaptor subunit [Nevskiaceae bacterium]
MRYIAIGLIVLMAVGVWSYKRYFSASAAAPVAAAAASSPAPAAPAPSGPPPGMPVEAEVAKAERIEQEIIAVGSLRSNESVTLSSEIAGRISGIHFKEGQPVGRGTLLFELDDSIYRAELDQARAGLALAERNHQRATELFERSMVSTRERDETASRLDVEKAAVALAQARLAKTRIRAPFEGVVGLRGVSPGDYITAGQALAPLEQLSVLKADFRLSEAALSAIKVGQTLNLEVDAWPGQVFPGRVYAIDPRLAEETRSIGVRARVPNDKQQLRPGLFARVRLVIAEREGAVLVPEQSIVPQGDKPFVYVIENGQAAMRAVQLGLRQSGRVEVVSGVKPGDVVITAGVQKIGPGAPVMAINLAPPGDAQNKTPAAGEKTSRPPG